MRIGIMLRAFDRAGGIGIYTRNILQHLLTVDKRNEYILLYNNEEHIGKYGDYPNVKEILIPPNNPIVWDHVLVPKIINKMKVDIIFHTKFSVPLLTRAKKIMVLHGAGWFVQPELWKRSDVMYQKWATPLYCRAADFLISNSDLTTQDFQRIFKIPDSKIRTVNLAAGENFRPVSETSLLGEVRKKYRLPEKFVLTVTSYDPARKNFDTLLAAYEEARKKTGVGLVVVGKNCEKYGQDFDFHKRGLEGAVHFPGWVEQQDLPAIYSLAEALLFPSVYETFGIPVVEAMACGCPVVSSNTGAIPSLVKDAGLLCAPRDREGLARNLLQILSSEETAARYRKLGLERAKEFSWEKAAQQTLEIFESVVLGNCFGSVVEDKQTAKVS